ncbi:hypothetical protein KQX54_017728 [Cotesia glomerata]|uniref:Uncharacterized protein n=1 Tax=Cotesia glomerata TaxID=32391 RepID=A0AAV7IRP4_COTGL|nr:hypothetical protein KQX54_017728 [Cotesia glomerata]
MLPEHQRKNNEKEEWRVYALKHTIFGDCWNGCKCSKNFYRSLDTKICINIEDCYKSKFIPSELETMAYSYDSSNNESLTEITN